MSHRGHRLQSSVLCSSTFGHRPAGTTRACLDQCDSAPDGRIDAQQKTETFPSNEAPRYEFAIGTGSTALWPRANYEPWASGPLPTPKYALELPASTNKTIRAYMKKFNNTLEGTDCGDAGLPANGYEMPKPKTTLRVVPKTPETSVRDHLSGPEANSTIASHSERGSRLPEPR
jgi:hypothetical protein